MNLWRRGEIRCNDVEFDFFQSVLRKEGLIFRQDEDASAFRTGTRCTAQTMNVRFLVGGKPDLEDVGDIREVHTAGDDISSYENGTCGCAEGVGDVCPLALAHARVKDADWWESRYFFQYSRIPL